MSMRYFILIFFSSVLFFSCSHKERNRNSIEFWTLQLSPTFDGFIHKMISEFETQNPGSKVIWVDVPYEGITQKFLGAISSGESPDVINLPADYVIKYAELGALSPLDSLLNDSIKSSYLPFAMKPMYVQNKLFGLPWYLATELMIYNKKKLQDAGIIQDSLPAAYSGLLKLAEKYHTTTGKFAFFYNLVVDSYLFQVLVSEGVTIVSPDYKRAVFNSPEGAAVIQKWVDAFRGGTMPRESILQGHRAGIDLYQSGNIAMFIGAAQFLRIIKENAPTIYAQTNVAPAVAGKTGKIELDVMCLVVSLKTRNSKLAAKFAAFVTNAKNQLEFSHTVPIFPSVVSALKDSYFTKNDGTLESKARTIAAKQIQNSEVMKPSLSHYQHLKEIFGDELLKAFLGDEPVKQSLDAAAEKWNKILAEK